MSTGEHLLAVRVVPNARKTGADGLMADGRTLKVRLAAPPVDGKANEALIRWLAEALGVRRSAVRIAAGEHAREKRLAVEGMDRAAMLERLLGAPAPGA